MIRIQLRRHHLITGLVYRVCVETAALPQDEPYHLRHGL